mgnify:CR=1 FL=1
MVSTLAAALLAALGLSGPAATPATTPAAPSFFVSGHGWGHGVGMAQYGAYGYALHGWTYDQIVAHYYPGTDLGDAPVKRVRVLLAGAAKKVTISSRSPFSVRDGSGKTHRLPAGKQQLGPGLKLKLPSSTKALPAPLVFVPGSSALALGSHSYRGSFRVTGGEEEAVALCDRTEVFILGESLGGVESLIEHPGRMTHASVAGTPLEVPGDLIRLSVGIETAEDLIADLERSLG